VPSYLKKGDLLFCDINPKTVEMFSDLNIKTYNFIELYGFSNDHCAMYIGNNMFVEACPYRYDEDTGNWIGVVKTHISTFHLWATNITFVSFSNISDDQRENAVNWALDRKGAPYQTKSLYQKNDDPNDSFDEYSNHWYCSELIWAAYKNQGIDLDSSDFGMVSNYDLINNFDYSVYDDEISGFWYPGLYFQWYTQCFFDYIII
jgi:uncharacterized protein YycO